MSTLKEEREAIVEEIGQIFADCFVNEARSWGEIKKDIDTALLSHEEKVMERVRKEKEYIFGEIEQFKSEVVTMNYNDDFKDGIYADHGTLNMDPEDVESKINDDTTAIVYVHFGGSSANLERFEEMAEEYKLDLICDAAQALGAPLSKRARFSCVSLQAIKSLTAGDGGILICRWPDDAIKARKLRWFGYDRELKQKMGDCDLDLAGYKLHMNDISAAIARGNLAEWDTIYAHRKAINDTYARLAVQNEYIPGIWNPQVIRRNFEALKPVCEAAGFEIGQYHYRNDKYSLFKKADAQCPSMDKYNDQYFMLPCHMGMTVEDAEMIAGVIWPQ